MKFRKYIKTYIVAAAVIISLAGCNKDNSTTTEASSMDLSESGISVTDMFTDNDMESGYDESDCTKIELTEDSATSDGESIIAENGDIKISKEGTYVFSGELENGRIVVDADKSDKIRIVLDNASITRKNSSAILVKNADKVFVTLASDSENILSSSGTFEAEDDINIDAAVFSKEDITFNGSGKLSIESERGHGIVSKDDLVFTGGNYSVVSEGHALNGKNSVRICDGNFEIESNQDGIHAENKDEEKSGFVYISGGEFEITSVNDAIDSKYAVQIDDGNFTLNTGGGSENASTDSNGNTNENWGKWGGGMTPPDGNPQDMQNSEMKEPPEIDENSAAEKTTPDIPSQDSTTSNSSENSDTETSDTEESAKGIKASSNLVINGGSFNIDSSDDSVHSNSDVVINGGEMKILSGDDGVHADSNTKITEGSINISKSYEGIEGQSIDISGGDIDIVSSDDGMNAAGGSDQSGLNGRPGAGSFESSEDCYIKISGSNTNISADGDGVDSNGTLEISEGTVYIEGSEKNQADTAIDYDGTGKITGGTVVAVGPGGMSQNFSEATQGTIMVNTGNQNSKTEIVLTDSSGNEIVSYTSEKSFSNVIISSPDIKKGSSYTLKYGENEENITMDDYIYGESGSGMKQRPDGMTKPDNMPQKNTQEDNTDSSETV